MQGDDTTLKAHHVTGLVRDTRETRIYVWASTLPIGEVWIYPWRASTRILLIAWGNLSVGGFARAPLFYVFVAKNITIIIYRLKEGHGNAHLQTTIGSEASVLFRDDLRLCYEYRQMLHKKLRSSCSGIRSCAAGIRTAGNPGIRPWDRDSLLYRPAAGVRSYGDSPVGFACGIRSRDSQHRCFNPGF
eukprot:1340461-Amorphochlora_amoeboformis.AAC.1